MSEYEITKKDWQHLHRFTDTDFMSMIMDYKEHRISQEQLYTLMELYVEESYRLGLFRGMQIG